MRGMGCVRLVLAALADAAGRQVGWHWQQSPQNQPSSHAELAPTCTTACMGGSLEWSHR